MPYIVQQTEEFRAWHKGLRDLQARIAISRRLERAVAGNLGDAKAVGEGVSEMRIDVGAGYRATSQCVATLSSSCFAVATRKPSSAISSTLPSLQRRSDMTLQLTTFDIVDHLDSEEAIAEYLSQVMADGDDDELLRALGHVAKARGMAQLAKDAGVGRESLYKALRPGATPGFATVGKVVRALGFKMGVSPVRRPIASAQKKAEASGKRPDKGPRTKGKEPYSLKKQGKLTASKSAQARKLRA